MLEILSYLFGKDVLTYRQKDFVKSFVMMFPLSYTVLLYDESKLLPPDLFSRCMVAACATIAAECLSALYLYIIGRLENKKPHTGVVYYAGPAYLYFLAFITGFYPLSSGLTDRIFHAYFIFFSPWLFYGLCLDIARRWRSAGHHNSVKEKGKSPKA